MARLAAFVVMLAVVSVNLRWNSQHLLPWVVRIVGVAVVALVVAFSGRRSWFPGGWRTVAERHPFRSVALLAIASLVATIGFAFYVHRPYPHIPDGFAYYFQAKIFAAGAPFATAPLLPEFFRFDWVVVHEGRWFSVFPPGWPLLLAAGVELGVPALVNPVLGSFCIIAVYRLGKALFGPRAGLLCALFCALSPFFLFMSAEFMSHTAALLFTSLSTLCHVQAMASRSGTGYFAGAGAAAGLGFLVRPVDALSIWAAQTLHGIWAERSRRVALGAAVSAVPLAGAMASYLLYNRTLVGAWFSSPLQLVSPRNRMGFGPDIGEGWSFPTPGHDPWRAFLNLNHNAAVMSQDLFGWPITSLFFVILLGVFGRKDARHGLCFGIVAASVVSYALYWYHGEAFGARFYFTLLPQLIMLTIEGIRQTPDIVARLVPGAGRAAVSRRTALAVATCFAFGWVVYVPKISLVGPYYDHKGVHDGFAELQRRKGLGEALVFVHAPRPVHYGPAFIANEIPIGTGNVIYARDLGDETNRRLIVMFPGRSVHRYTHEPHSSPVKAWMVSVLRSAGLSR